MKDQVKKDEDIGDVVRSIKIGWPQMLDGKTPEQCKEKGCIVHDDWTIEVEEMPILEREHFSSNKEYEVYLSVRDANQVDYGDEDIKRIWGLINDLFLGKEISGDEESLMTAKGIHKRILLEAER